MSMKLTMRLKDSRYDIIIKDGAIGRINQLINLNRKALIVTDDGVPPQYAETVKAQCGEGIIVTVPQGEGSKSIETYAKLLGVMLENTFSRKDVVIAVGGGVVGDLSGFVAASYMRGVDFINCPTTTLAQIDSSIGGKTAVNLNGTKNIVGAFYQPKLVIIDPETLKTLSPRHYSEGLAEAVKAGILADPELFEIFENEDIAQNLEKIIYRSLVFKKNIVEQDEHENGVRACLNFGHTIGHAIESYEALGGLCHGECVALGMLPMTQSPALRKRMRAVYKKLNLPCSVKYDGDKIFAILKHDKKAAGGKITIVKVPQLGQFTLEKVDIDELRDMVKEGVR